MPTHGYGIGVKKTKKKIIKLQKEDIQNDPYIYKFIEMIRKDPGTDNLIVILNKIYEDGFSDGFNNKKGKV